MAKFFPVIKIASGVGALERANQKQAMASVNRKKFLESKESLASKIEEYSQKIVDRYGAGQNKRGSNRMKAKLMGMVDEYEALEAREEKMLSEQTRGTQAQLKRVGRILGTAVVLQTVNTLTSNIGFFAQDQAVQNRMNNVMNVVNRGVSVFQYAALGASAGPIGAVVGAAVGLGMQALEIGINNQKMLMRIQDRQISQVRDTNRLGYIVTSKGR